MRTFGIEEEFLLIDPATGLPGKKAAEVIARAAPGASGQPELLTCQVEHATGICTTVEEAAADLLEFRVRIAAAAAEAGQAVAVTGAAPRISGSPADVTDVPRYRLMGAMTGAVGMEQYVNGTHVHVAVADPEEGVRVLNGLRPWLGTLGALAANSPFWRGRDSRFSSWRLVHYRRWSVQGCPPQFADAADYSRRLAALLATDVVLDAGHVGWAARLSGHLPTVEVRVADAQLEAADSVLLAALIRALVSTLAGQPPEDGPADPELLDVGLWQAARYGLDGNLLGHGTPHAGLRSAREQLQDLMMFVSPELEASGDLPYVRNGLARLLAHGTGARRQRRAAADGGARGVAGLFAAALTAR
ncbi:Carboxylate-amine ligase YbdK [Arthrobacter saudimassiliensis]|uniref:Putative glutamate--cysteine ligase 2 n=1 Tax=Arthrobacter saudimassiliensis TaxID=1461584 RepID=A0A078MQR0_9MICC|nr:Carboxylate-amine ligase YbdK [Arthrobacter saudimassiliensis]